MTERQRERTRECSKARGLLLSPSWRGARAPRTVAGDGMEKRSTSKARDAERQKVTQKIREIWGVRNCSSNEGSGSSF